MNTTSPPSPPHSLYFSKKTLCGLLILLAIVWFGSIEFRKLVRPDEGRYAEIPREMVASGDWVLPRLNGLLYFEKPALQYWATAIFYTLFGEHHWTARLWSALTGFLGILLCYWAGNRWWGKPSGLLASIICSSMLFYTLIGHINTLDMGVSFFLNLGLGGLIMAQMSNTTPAQDKKSLNVGHLYAVIGWSGLSASVLSKGLIGLVLPLLSLFIYGLCFQREKDFWLRLHLRLGLLVMALLCAPWFILASLQNQDFFAFFFVREHFIRFLTKEHDRYQPFWYFIPILFMGLLPWSVLLPETIWKAWRTPQHQQYPLTSPHATNFQLHRFLLIWIGTVFIFFSASSSKLVSYILPIFPGIALLMAYCLMQFSIKGILWRILTPLTLIAIAILILAPHVIEFADPTVPVSLYTNYIPWLYATGGGLLLGSIIGAGWVWWTNKNAHTQAQKIRQKIGLVLCVGTASLIGTQLVLSGHDSLAPANSAYHIAQKIIPHLKPQQAFYSLGIYEQTLPFYIKRTLSLVDFEDELDFGITQEPERYIATYEEFSILWKKESQGALAIMSPSFIDYFDTHQLPYHIIARDTRRLVVQKP